MKFWIWIDGVLAQRNFNWWIWCVASTSVQSQVLTLVCFISLLHTEVTPKPVIAPDLNRSKRTWSNWQTASTNHSMSSWICKSRSYKSQCSDHCSLSIWNLFAHAVGSPVPLIQPVPFNLQSIKKIGNLIALTCSHVKWSQTSHLPATCENVAHVSCPWKLLPISSSYWLSSQSNPLIGPQICPLPGIDDLLSTTIQSKLAIFITSTNDACFIQDPGIWCRN